ncbi:hypothetical protein G6F59_016467 [Rhizopus arrhizus]|nr:hypothetical protein G6F59_016467 [Rhizopus arrhizus]
MPCGPSSCAPDPRVRGLHPPVARQYEAGLQGQGVLLALRFRDLARRRRHALDARAQLLGAVDRQQRVQRPADAGARFASAVHFVRGRNPERALQAIAEEAGVWRAGPGQPAIAGGAGRHPLHDGQGRFGGVLRLQHDARLEQQHLAVAAR